MGFLVAILVGALTLGLATPHLFNAFGGIEWRFTITVASVVALGVARLINLFRLGLRSTISSPFDTRNLLSRPFPGGRRIGLLPYGIPG